MGAYTSEKVTGKPLYCFKYNEETGELDKKDIMFYTVDTNYWTKRRTYCFDCPEIVKSTKHYSVAENKLDRYVSGKVFTFNSDTQYAKAIILAELTGRQFKAYTEYQKYAEQVEKFLNANPEFDNERSAT